MSADQDPTVERLQARIDELEAELGVKIPTATVEDGVARWTDADGVEHSGPFAGGADADEWEILRYEHMPPSNIYDPATARTILVPWGVARRRRVEGEGEKP